jgi:CheY-like chemotaxis protein
MATATFFSPGIDMKAENSDSIVNKVLETATLDDGSTLELMRYFDGGYGIAEDCKPLAGLRWGSGEIEQCHAEFRRVVAARKSTLAIPQPLTKKRILAVDDEPHIAEMIKLYLERFGEYEVQTQSDPQRVMETARSFRPDVILLDVMMPEPDGSELAAFLHEDEQLAKVPIIFVTALASENRAPFGVDRNRYLTKPINFDELIQRIEQATMS